ncbi:hypothetical protein CKO10_04565, partial [Rhodospirillum rubrum]|nr:hypothetical protein [Rhodospirillum rubrum]
MSLLDQTLARSVGRTLARATLPLVGCLAQAAAANAQGLPQNDVDGAIGTCIGREGANGDEVGDLVLDLKTGKTVFRCNSDSATTTRSLAPA